MTYKRGREGRMTDAEAAYLGEDVPGWYAVPVDTPHAMPEEGEPRRRALTPFRLFAKKCRDYRPEISDAEIEALWQRRPPMFEQKLLKVIRVAEAAGYTEEEL